MRAAGSASWRISEDMGWSPTVALYIRDRLGLADESGVPPLAPTVAPERVDQRWAEAWHAWFAGLVNAESRIRRDPREQLAEQAGYPEFRAVVGSLLDEASEWASQRKKEHIEEFMRRRRAHPLLVNRIVDDVARTLGRKPVPFELRITMLPVEGFWAHRAAADHLLVSEQTRSDPDRIRAVLEPILLEIA
jgi:glutathione S-transferase